MRQGNYCLSKITKPRSLFDNFWHADSRINFSAKTQHSCQPFVTVDCGLTALLAQIGYIEP